jgi:repressor LexA
MTAPVTTLLTRRQVQVLEAIRGYAQKNGYAPSMREISDRTGLALSEVQYQVEQLAAKGWIRRHPNRPRALVALNPTDGTDT